MGQIRNLLAETREFAQDLKKSSDNDPINNIQLNCQIWTLGKIICFVDTINKMMRTLKQKQK